MRVSIEVLEADNSVLKNEKKSLESELQDLKQVYSTAPGIGIDGLKSSLKSYKNEYDVVLVHVGTNDVWESRTPDDMGCKMKDLIEMAHSTFPSATFVRYSKQLSHVIACSLVISPLKQYSQVVCKLEPVEKQLQPVLRKLRFRTCWI
ncbi:hypothetical protein LSTR_LSTR012035 [Laodelphax striatellus]|uniref:Uncharacterized protein n=1 Tax=Laodelphax striatellus TaxID=195883 RepID=A0A482XLX5_LAOST|nr:hypothetical protein LSTR_LSTR012035 [Laodelphax striatellus]